ncbi:MAG: CRISPR-associated RAMP protein Csx7 [Candidatus Sericytochromatia bacterium]
MLKLDKKYFIKAKVQFDTAFHIGSGKAGDGRVDNGILKDFQGKPILTGSTLKGNFRALAERISHSLNQTACFLDMNLSSGNDFECINGVSNDRYRDLKKDINKSSNPYDYMKNNKYICDICNLFGSKIHASRIFFSDGLLNLDTWNDITYIRDGVVIDRDTETARDSLKYDFEVAPENTTFDIKIEIENPSKEELNLIQAVLTIWKEGFSVGGNSSRGLGKAHLKDLEIKFLDFSDQSAFSNFIKNGAEKLPVMNLSALS